LESLKKTLKILEFNGKSLKFFRSDSADYQSKIINYCQDHGIRYTIAADFDYSVIEDIGRIPSTAWLRIKDREDIPTDYEYAETTHIMNDSSHSFRFTVKRKRDLQIDIFGDVSYPPTSCLPARQTMNKHLRSNYSRVILLIRHRIIINTAKYNKKRYI